MSTTLTFARAVNDYCKNMGVTPFNKDYISQIIRSASSIGANYRESQNNLGKKDEVLRLRTSRKEARETIFWLELLQGHGDEDKRQKLLQEAIIITKILSAILKNKEKKLAIEN